MTTNWKNFTWKKTFPWENFRWMKIFTWEPYVMMKGSNEKRKPFTQLYFGSIGEVSPLHVDPWKRVVLRHNYQTNLDCTLPNSTEGRGYEGIEQLRVGRQFPHRRSHRWRTFYWRNRRRRIGQLLCAACQSPNAQEGRSRQEWVIWNIWNCLF